MCNIGTYRCASDEPLVETDGVELSRYGLTFALLIALEDLLVTPEAVCIDELTRVHLTSTVPSLRGIRISLSSWTSNQTFSEGLIVLKTLY